jgi:hypothetical protein
MQPQQPRLQVAPHEAGISTFLHGAQHGQAKTKYAVLRFTLWREGVEKLGAAGDEQSGLETALTDPERRPQQLGLPEAEELSPLAPVERDANQGEGLEGGLVSGTSSPRAAGDRTELPPLTRQ